MEEERRQVQGMHEMGMAKLHCDEKAELLQKLQRSEG